MTHQCRMGWPAALAALEPQDRKAHVTPPREVHGKVRTGFEALDYSKWHAGPSEADCRQIKEVAGTPLSAYQSEIDAFNAWVDAVRPQGNCKQIHAQWLTSHARDCWLDFIDYKPKPEAAPPSTTDKPQGVFKVGDRVRVVKFGGGKVMPGEVGTVTSVDPDGGGGLSLDRWPGAWAFNREWVELLQPDPDGWIEHKGDGMPVDGETMVQVRHRDGAESGLRRASHWHHHLPASSCWVNADCGFDITHYRVVKP